MSDEELNQVRKRLSGVQHRRIGPGRCSCGYNAYAYQGIMLDYAEMIANHLRRCRDGGPVVRLDDARALLAEVDRLRAEIRDLEVRAGVPL